MLEKSFGRKGQVSIEILLIAGIVIMISMSVFSNYTQIRQSTLAMQFLKVEAIKAIDANPEQLIIEKIDYKIADNDLDICIFTLPPGTEPEKAIWDTSNLTPPEVDEMDIEDIIKDRTGFDSVDVHQNPDQGPGYPCS